jgi:hypothetical protein
MKMYLLLFLLLSFFAFAQDVNHIAAFDTNSDIINVAELDLTSHIYHRVGLEIDGAVSWIFDSDFETEGDDGDWTTSGTVDFNYASSGESMGGSECARVNGASYIRHNGMTTSGTVYVMAAVRTETVLNGVDLGIVLRDTSDDQMAKLWFHDNGIDDSSFTLKGTVEGTNTDTGFTVTDGDQNYTYWVKMYYTPHATANEIGISYWNGSSWESYITKTANGDEDAIEDIILRNDNTNSMDYQYYDDIFVSSIDFTADPTTYSH